jgi:type IX secretion system PorP/SprF family membrane protein
MKSLLTILSMFLLLSPPGKLIAQQLAQYSQYLDNYYLINPAATDIQNNLQVKLGFRHYWTDFEGSPKTVYLSAYAPLSKPLRSQYMQSAMRLSDKIDTASLKTLSIARSNHMVGMIITQDDIGLFRKTTSHLTYTFHMPLSRKLQVAVAPKLGWVHLSLNEDLRVLEENDQPFQEFVDNYQKQGMMDLGFGLWLYSDRLFAGYSLEQLTRSRGFSSSQLDGFEFEPHHFVMAGYRFRVSPRLNLIPHMLIRYIPDGTTSTDLSLKAKYGSKLSAGFSYRRSNALVMIFGAAISSQFSFTYSFDHSTNINTLNRINAHEISLNMKLLPELHK